nr:hypothetical protein [Tanacetum cinerariifolium]
MAQKIDFFGSDQIQTPQYPNVHPPSQEISDEVVHAKDDLINSIQTFLEEFHCIPLEEKPLILLQAWFKFFAIKHDQPESSNELFHKLFEDLKELAEYKESLKNSSTEIIISSSNQEKEEPSQDSDIRKLIREECCVEASEEQKQSMENTMLELVKIFQEKEFLCILDNVEDLIESALNSKLLSINSQRLEKEHQEVKNVVEQPVELTPILSTKEPEYSSSMGYEHLSITPKTEPDEVTRECDVLVCKDSSAFDDCDDHSDIFFDSKIDDDIFVYDDDFEDTEYVEASLFDPEIVSVEEEVKNVVHQEEEEIDLEDISQIQDVVLREKLLSITHLIANIESLNDNFTPNQTRSGNTTHADNSLPEYDSFCFEIEPDQERLINVMKNDIPDDSSRDLLLEEANLFLAFVNSIPLGIENVSNDSEGDIRFLEELLIDDSILSHESSDPNFEDNPSVPRPPSELPDAETDTGKEIPVVMNDKDKFDEDYYFFMIDKVFSLLSVESEDTIFDPGISD